MKVVAIIQARLGSTRLPGKVLADLSGEPMLAHVVWRTAAVAGVDEVVVATTDRPADDAIASLCAQRGWPSFRGSEPDVLDRYYRAAVAHQADHVVRVTSDCPLVCTVQASRVVERHLQAGNDYTHNITVWGSGLPLGANAEIFRLSALEAAWRDGREPHHREHVDEYVYEHPERFRIERVDAPPELHRPTMRITVDTPEDIERVRRIYARLYRPGALIDVREVVALLDAEAA